MKGQMNKSNIEKTVNHPVKRKIIRLLKKESSLSLGEISKKLLLSNRSGLQYILELKKSGIIKNDDNPTKYRLNTNLHSNIIRTVFRNMIALFSF